MIWTMRFFARTCFFICCIPSWTVAAAPPTGRAAPKIVTVRGHLVDMVCVKEEAARLPELGPRHTRKCLQMPACRESGYGLLLPSNEVLRFDQRGNDLATKLVSERHPESGWLLRAQGKQAGGMFAVTTLEFVPAKAPVKKGR
jgi:hypothetical protein